MPTVTRQEQTSRDTVECRGAAVTPTIRLRRMMIDGLARVSPIGGTHYLKFLETLHRKREVRRYLEIGTQSGMPLRCATG